MAFAGSPSLGARRGVWRRGGARPCKRGARWFFANARACAGTSCQALGFGPCTALVGFNSRWDHMVDAAARAEALRASWGGAPDAHAALAGRALALASNARGLAASARRAAQQQAQGAAEALDACGALAGECGEVARALERAAGRADALEEQMAAAEQVH